MTKKELVDFFKEYPDDIEVYVECSEYSFFLSDFYLEYVATDDVSQECIVIKLNKI